MVRLLFHMFFLHLSHLSLPGHQSWLRSTVTCALIHAYSLHQILSLLHCHPYRPTGTLNTVLHVNICYTLYRYFMLFHHYIVTEIHNTITTCLWTINTRIRYYTGYHYMDTLCMSYTTVMYTHRSTCIDCLCVPVTWIMDYIITHGYSCILVILIIVYVT